MTREEEAAAFYILKLQRDTKPDQIGDESNDSPFVFERLRLVVDNLRFSFIIIILQKSTIIF